jgi:hypothetical protein
MKKAIRTVGRELSDFLFGQPIASEYKKLEPQVRELYPRTAPLDDKRDLLLIQTELKGMFVVRMFVKYLQPTLTTAAACGVYLNQADRMSNFDLGLTFSVMGALKGAIYLLGRLDKRHIKNNIRHYLQNLKETERQSMRGEEWKLGTDYPFSGDI